MQVQVILMSISITIVIISHVALKNNVLLATFNDHLAISYYLYNLKTDYPLIPFINSQCFTTLPLLSLK